MKVVVAIDSLKGSLTSNEAGLAIKKGIERACAANVVIKPLADGGEGTVEALVTGMNGELRTIPVCGPLGETLNCTYGYLKESNTAIIEMAEAAGIILVPTEKLNPWETTTYGVGQIIAEAAADGIRNFIIGIGGSATNDCGAGMLQALGYRFYDKNGSMLGQGGKVLADICNIDDSAVPAVLQECSFRIACDVTNPLCGPNGASAVYGPQKGADKEMVRKLDDGCRNFAQVTARKYGSDYVDHPGAGAAGGLGFAFLAFLNGQLESGIDIVLKEIKLEEDCKDADYVITGEGRLDFQTAMGKAPIGVAKLGKKYGAKVIALAGCTTDDAGECNMNGIDAFFPIINTAMPVEEAMKKEVSEKNMSNTAEQVFRLICAIKEK